MSAGSSTDKKTGFLCTACEHHAVSCESRTRFVRVKTLDELQKVMIECCLGKLVVPFYFHRLFNPLCTMSWRPTIALAFAELQCLGLITTYSQLESYDAVTNRFEKPCISGLMSERLAQQLVDHANASPDLVAFITRQSGNMESLAISGDSKQQHYSWCNPCLADEEADLFAPWCPAIYSIVKKHQLVSVTVIGTNFMRPSGTMLETVLLMMRKIIRQQT